MTTAEKVFRIVSSSIDAAGTVQRLKIMCAGIAILGLSACGGKPVAHEDPGWQALFEDQKKEIQRLEEEVRRLRADCRAAEPLVEAPAPPPGPTSEPVPAAAAAEGFPEIRSLVARNLLSLGGKHKLEIRGTIANPGAAQRLAVTFEPITAEGQSYGDWSWIKDLPAGLANLTEDHIVSGERPARLRLTIRTQGSPLIKKEISVLDVSPVVPSGGGSAPSRGRGGRLVMLNGPSIQQVSPDEILVDGRVWNSSSSDSVTQAFTVRLLREGSVVDEETVYVEDLAPGGEKPLVIRFRGDGTGGPFTTDVVF